VKEMLDATFIQQVQGNILGGAQVLGSGQPIDKVRAGFLKNMEHIFRMREMAFAYFADAERIE
jgi:hypothetical protein